MIHTPRLTIRPYTPDDLDALFEILSDVRTMSFWPRPYTRDEAKAWMERSLKSTDENGFGRWAVILNESGRLIGDCGIVRSEVDGRQVYDLGYILYKDYWGNGYATEAARAWVRYAFDTLKLDTISVNMPANHDASRGVAERLGMKKIGEFDNARNRGIRTLLYQARP